MLIKSEEIERLISEMNQGLIYIDSNCDIGMFNEKAKEIVGLKLKHIDSHNAGCIERGDIVIIADNCIGGDDGNLSSKDLKVLNIHNAEIEKGDKLLAVGVYDNDKIDPVYKHLRGNQLNSEFALETNYLGNSIVACIDENQKNMRIGFNSGKYELKNFQAMGHMVVVDGKSGKVKFFQEKGYSIRKEEIGTLLKGRSFQPKNSKGFEMELKGVNLTEIFEESELTTMVCDYFKNQGHLPVNGLHFLNKRLVYCSFYNVSNDDSSKGLYIVIKDASDLDEYLMDRNTILEQVEKRHKYDNVIHKGFPSNAFSLFVGNSPEVDEVKFLAYRAAQTKFNVIITGESGTGKSLLAREIHNNSANPKAPFVEVNCNAIAPTLFESELFGYVGGAFTGASTNGKVGYFEEADGGTIFLDEIGDIPLEIQVKLLHVLQNKIIYRVGSSKPIDIDVRVIAATNLDLEKEVARGSFRQDLYYRINVFPIDIPPLRRRKRDLYVLINDTLKRICTKYNLENKQFSGEALSKILRYDWPGNVRELENVIERAITLCSTRVIYPEHIKIGKEKCAFTLKEMLAQEEKRLIKNSLELNNWDKEKTISELNISRTTFYEKLRKFKIE